MEEEQSVGRHVERTPRAMSKHQDAGTDEGEPDKRLGRVSATEARPSMRHLVALPMWLVPGDRRRRRAGVPSPGRPESQRQDVQQRRHQSLQQSPHHGAQAERLLPSDRRGGQGDFRRAARPGDAGDVSYVVYGPRPAPHQSSSH